MEVIGLISCVLQLSNFSVGQEDIFECNFKIKSHLILLVFIYS